MHAARPQPPLRAWGGGRLAAVPRVRRGGGWGGGWWGAGGRGGREGGRGAAPRRRRAAGGAQTRRRGGGSVSLPASFPRSPGRGGGGRGRGPGLKGCKGGEGGLRRPSRQGCPVAAHLGQGVSNTTCTPRRRRHAATSSRIASHARAWAALSARVCCGGCCGAPGAGSTAYHTATPVEWRPAPWPPLRARPLAGRGA